MVTAGGEGLAFILSTPRAGSSLLCAILGNHPDVLCPPEPWFLLSLVGMRDDKLLATSRYDYPLAQQGIRDFLDRDLFNEAIRAFAVAAYNGHLSRANKEIFVDKTPRYYHIARELSELFPRARTIRLLRNPLDVIASCKESWGLTIGELLGDPLTPHSFDVTTSLLALVKLSDDDHPRRITVRYEGLCSEPGSHLVGLYQALGVSYNENALNFSADAEAMNARRRAVMGDRKLLDTTSVHRDSIGRWRAILDRAELQYIVRTLGRDIFLKLGYVDEFDDAFRRSGLGARDCSEYGKLREIEAELSAYEYGSLTETGQTGSGQRMAPRQSRIARRLARKELEARLYRRRVTDLEGQIGALRAQQDEADNGPEDDA